jgi:hypothetical protein
MQYEIVDNESYRFRVEDYNTGYDLVIDPELVYSTYLGGKGENQANDVAINDQGCVYVTGNTSPDFPITSGAYNTTYRTIFLSKLNANGTSLLYSTFFGGSNEFNFANDIKVDSIGDVYLTGYTGSSDFPITPNALAKTVSGYEAFVTKINSKGSKLVYSAIIGGSKMDIASSLAIDNQGCAYIAGCTLSTDFPITKGAYREKMTDYTLDYPLEGFVIKLDQNGSNIVFSSFLGKIDNQECFLTLDTSRNVFVAGNTGLSGFPVTPGAYHHFLGGMLDIFITKLDFNGGTCQ